MRINETNDNPIFIGETPRVRFIYIYLAVWTIMWRTDRDIKIKVKEAR